MATYQADVVFTPVIPSFRGYSALMAAGTLKSSKVAGLASGLAFGNAFQSQAKRSVLPLEQVQKRVAASTEIAAKRIVRARRDEEDAARKVGVAEAKLTEVRAKSGVKSSELRTAEDRLVKSQNGLRDAQGRTTVATRDQNDALDKGKRQLSDAEKAAKRADGAYGKLGRGLKIVGAAAAIALVGLGAAAVRGLTSAIEPASKFQQSINLVGVTTKETGQGLKDLTALALDMGAKTSFSAQGASDAMVELAKGGLTAAQIKAGALQSTLTLATAGGLGLGNAATYIVQGLTSFGIAAKDAGVVAAALAGGANASTASVQSLGEALSQVGPGAKTAGLGLQDTVAILSAFDNAGLKGSDAGTSLKTFLTRLVPTTLTAQRAMEQYGLVTVDAAKASEFLISKGIKPLSNNQDDLNGQLKDYATTLTGNKSFNAEAVQAYLKIGRETGSMSNAFFDAKGNIKGAADVAGVLQKALGGLTNEQKIAATATLFGSDAARAAAVLSDTGAKKLGEYVAQVKDQSAAEKLAANATKGFAGAKEALGGGLETLQIQVGTFLLPVLTKLAQLITTQVLPRFSDLVDQVGPKLGPAINDLIPKVQMFVTQLTDLAKFLYENRTAVAGAAIAVVGFTVVLGALGVATKVVAGVQAVMTGASLAWKAAGLAASAVTKVWAAGQVLLNVALSANPIGLIVIGIAALVAGLILAYRNSATFRAIVQGAFAGIKIAISAVVGFVTTVAVPAILAFFAKVKGVAASIGGFFTGIAASVSAFFTGLVVSGARIGLAIQAAVTGFFTAIGAALTTAYNTVIAPVIGFLVAAFRAVGTAFSTIYNGLIRPVFELFAAITKAVFQTVFGAVMAKVQLVWAAMGQANRLIYNSVIKPVINAFGAVIRYFQNVFTVASRGIQIIWAAVGAKVRSVYTGTIKPILDFFAVRIVQARRTFELVGAALKLAWTLVGNRIRDVYNVTIRAVLGFFSTKINQVKAVFSAAGSAIRTAWGNVGSRIRDVYNATVKPALDFFASKIRGLKSVFQTAVNAIRSQWDRLKEIAKAPVRFVINTVINGLIGGFNKLADTFHTTRIQPLALPAGFATGGILPGRSSFRDGDSVPIMARPGEGWTVSEAMDSYESARLLALNRAALGGVSAAQFRGRWDGQGFAKGGRVKPTRSGRQNASYAGHSGIDFYGVTGDPIFATTGGQISYTGAGRGYGNAVFETSLNGLQMVYGHMSQILAKVGQVVSAGAQIGKVGYSGNVRPAGPMGAHLHYEVAPGGAFSQASNRGATQSFLGGAALGGTLSGSGTDPGFNPLDAIKGIIAGPLAKLKEVSDSPFGKIIAGIPRAFVNTLKDKATSLLGGGVANTGRAMAASAWAPVLTTALGLNRLPLSQLDNWIRQVASESGGNPRAIQQVRDVNSGGNEAAGLLQVIPGTFAAYRSKALPNDRLNPLANAFAAMNYAKCVPLDTMILTRRGWLAHDEVQVGDETIGYNSETGMSEWTLITHVHHYDEAPLVRFTNPRMAGVRVTPNHRWVTKKYIQTGTAQPNYYRTETAETWQIGSRHRIIVGAPLDADSKLDLSDAEAELLGWILGDGSVQIRDRPAFAKRAFNVLLDQSNAKPNHQHALRSLMTVIPHAEYARGGNHWSSAGGLRYRLPSKYARDLMDRSGYVTNPQAMVLGMSSDQRQRFISGVMWADGNLPNVGSPIITQNAGWKMDAIRLALYMEGYYAVSARTRDDAPQRRDVSLSTPHVKGGYPLEDAGVEPVWCVTTDLETWTMRQCDAIMLTGNSRYGKDGIEGVIGHGHGYDSGGFLPPGYTVAFNGTGKPEPVFTTQQWDLMAQSRQSGAVGPSYSFGDSHGVDAKAIAREFFEMVRQREALTTW